MRWSSLRSDDGASGSVLACATADMRRCWEEPVLWNFDTALSGAGLDADSDAVACGLAAQGVSPGDCRGETMYAFINLAADAVKTPKEIMGFAGQRLAAYKRPRRVVILDELPKTASGKIRRRALCDAQHLPSRSAA